LFAKTVVWRCSSLDSGALAELDAAITELQKMRSTGASFGLLAVDDEFFVIVRPSPRGPSLLLSDAAAALDYDIAADVLDLLRVDPPDEDDESVCRRATWKSWPTSGFPGSSSRSSSARWTSNPDEQLHMNRAALRLRDRTRVAPGRDLSAQDVIRRAGGDSGRPRLRCGRADRRGRLRARRHAAGERAQRRKTRRPDRTRRNPRLAAAAGCTATAGASEGCHPAVTVEPCTMCAGALVLAQGRAGRLRCLGTENRRAGPLGVVAGPAAQPPSEVIGGVLEDECAALLEDFFARHRPRPTGDSATRGVDSA